MNFRGLEKCNGAGKSPPIQKFAISRKFYGSPVEEYFLSETFYQWWNNLKLTVPNYLKCLATGKHFWRRDADEALSPLHGTPCGRRIVLGRGIFWLMRSATAILLLLEKVFFLCRQAICNLWSLSSCWCLHCFSFGVKVARFRLRLFGASFEGWSKNT